MSRYSLKLKRVYEEAEQGDGFRVLVDRLWPRGLSKKNAHVDLWLKDISPSNALRKWFSHDPAKWAEFQKRYRKELRVNREAVLKLKQIIREEKKNITILFSSSDEKYNNAIALRKILKL